MEKGSFTNKVKKFFLTKKPEVYFSLKLNYYCENVITTLLK